MSSGGCLWLGRSDRGAHQNRYCFHLMALLCPDECCAEFSTAQACVGKGSRRVEGFPLGKLFG